MEGRGPTLAGSTLHVSVCVRVCVCVWVWVGRTQAGTLHVCLFGGGLYRCAVSRFYYGAGVSAVAWFISLGAGLLAQASRKYYGNNRVIL
jgi:hypothetical protein